MAQHLGGGGKDFLTLCESVNQSGARHLGAQGVIRGLPSLVPPPPSIARPLWIVQLRIHRGLVNFYYKFTKIKTCFTLRSQNYQLHNWGVTRKLFYSPPITVTSSFKQRKPVLPSAAKTTDCTGLKICSYIYF